MYEILLPSSSAMQLFIHAGRARQSQPESYLPDGALGVGGIRRGSGKPRLV
jgi:hypothetical protein